MNWETIRIALAKVLPKIKLVLLENDANIY